MPCWAWSCSICFADWVSFLIPPWIWVGENPLIYYMGLFGDICTPIFCFCSGYAHFTAAAVLSGLFLVRLPGWAEKCFLLLGKHSTNIWLVHMFFSSGLFCDFVFLVRYPVLILGLMLMVSFAVSTVIDWLYQPVLEGLQQRLHTRI